jgi:thioredoxin 1
MVNVNVKDITADDFEEEVLKSDKIVLVDFFATWCGPCQKMSKVLEQISADRPDLKVVRVDIDDNELLARQFFVRSIPTVVYMKNGKEFHRIVGFTTRDQLLSIVG